MGLPEAPVRPNLPRMDAGPACPTPERRGKGRRRRRRLGAAATLLAGVGVLALLLRPDELAAYKDQLRSRGGEKLHYQPLPGKRMLLYSVGENGKDEQGRNDDVLWLEGEPVSE